MDTDDLVPLMRTMLPKKDEEVEVEKIEVMPFRFIAIKKSAINEENRVKFVKIMVQIPKITKGTSWKIFKDLGMNEAQGFVAMAIGRAFKVWQLIPMDWDEPMKSDALKNDPLEQLPMHTGFSERSHF